MSDPNVVLLGQVRIVRRVLVMAVVCLVGILCTNIYFVVQDVTSRRERYALEHTFDKQSREFAEDANWEALLKTSLQRQQSNPRDANGYWMAGMAYYNKKRYQEATVSYKKAAEINPAWGTNAKGWIKSAEELAKRQAPVN
jgi:cytochrome c-type biogenesis protein CcmH/NrfG